MLNITEILSPMSLARATHIYETRFLFSFTTTRLTRARDNGDTRREVRP